MRLVRKLITLDKFAISKPLKYIYNAIMHRVAGLIEVVKVIAIVFVSAVLIRTFVFQPYVVEGASMEKNFHNGEYLFVEKITYKIKEPERGDVVVFRYPRDPRYNYIKRIIGLPGETVQIKDGQVYVNDELLNEDYIPAGEKTYLDSSDKMSYEITLEEDQFYVMGDNRSHSSDSRTWGPLEKRYIIGKSAIVLYPQTSFRAIASPKY